MGLRKKKVLWFGRTKSLDEDFNEGEFRTIDTRETTTIPVNAKKVELLTKHPTGSYELEKEDELVTYLHITDPEEFWKANKYLVLEVKS